MPLCVVRREMLGEKVRGVVLAVYLLYLQITASHAVLEPKVLDSDVSQLSQSLPPYDAQRCAGICVYLSPDGDSEVIEERNASERLSGAFRQSI